MELSTRVVEPWDVPLVDEVMMLDVMVGFSLCRHQAIGSDKGQETINKHHSNQSHRMLISTAY